MSRIAERPLLSTRWESRDRHRYLTIPAVSGMAIAAALAVFGLPPLDLHGPLHFLGVMDPACGMTRGVRLVLRGDLVAAFRYNPASPLVVAVMSLAVLRAAYGRLTGRWLTVRLRWSPGLLTALAIAVIALEVNQQLHASLLLARH